MTRSSPRRRGPFAPRRASALVLAFALVAALGPLAALAQDPGAPPSPPAAAAAPAGAAAPAQAPGATSPPPTAGPPAAGPRRVLSLEEAVRAAREHQPQLAQARAQREAAAARADQARAPLLPQLSATASYQRATENFVARPGSLPSTTAARAPAAASWASTNFWSGGATLSQLVWDFGQTSGRWRAAQAAAEAQRGSEVATESQVLLSVRTTYFAARAQRDLVAVAREALANQEAHLRQAEGFVRLGTRPEVELAQARTDRANAAVQLIRAENGYDTARAQLNQAMGVDAPLDYDVGDEVLPPVPGEEGGTDALFGEALRGRPDLRALEAQARAQELLVGAARGGYGPSLGVATGLTDAGPALDSTTWNWTATATLTWNLFQGGLTRAQVGEARANLASAQAQADVLRGQIRVDVESARLAVRAAQGELLASAEAVTSARERLRLAERRYETGVGSLLEVSDAQVAATQAAAQRVQAQYDLSSSRAQLLRALGREVPRG